MRSQKHPLELDTECYPNYWLLKFRSYRTGAFKKFELHSSGDGFDRAAVRRLLANYLLITFNGIHYDIPMVMLAMTGATVEQLKVASDMIIVEGMKSWEFYRYYNLDEPTWIDHIDLKEVAPGDGSLKLYGGRLHSKQLQDLPYDPDKPLDPFQKLNTDSYCGNDLDTTHDLAVHLDPQLELRELMTEMYGVDLRSKSDAQIAEAVIKSELTKLIGAVKKASIPAGSKFRYKPPSWMRFETEQMQLRLNEIADSIFVTDKNGTVIEPPALENMVVKIGQGLYRMGIGGLHSSETNVAHHARDGMVLMDADVTSYYPAIILGLGLFPQHLTDRFLAVYRTIFDRRVAAKRSGDSTVEKVLKIVLNGSFGKFGSKYSILYSPNLLIQTTVTGQLALLMLIERLHLDGINCVSANTDGIVLYFHESRRADVDAHIAAWSEQTGFAMEKTSYRSLYSRDVNNYIAVKASGGVKGKGDYADISIAKNPNNAIVNDAVKLFVEHGTPVDKTIRECQDIRKFVTVQRMNGGAVRILKTNYDESLTPDKKRDLLLANGWHVAVPGPLAKLRLAPMAGEPAVTVEAAYRAHCGEDELEYIGKVVRFYIGRGQTGALHSKKRNESGNRSKVPCSDGAVLCMTLPDALPDDIDYDYYIADANEVLRLIGAKQ